MRGRGRFDVIAALWCYAASRKSAAYRGSERIFLVNRVNGRRVAISGYGCRLPGAGDVAAFWRLLTEGRCAIGRVPEDRWNAASFLSTIQGLPGATYTNSAGVVDRVFDFDPAFFGVSPREAAQMDPQQRLLLMTAWEALESAGAAPEVYADARTGVFVGASGLDYGNVQFGDPASGDSMPAREKPMKGIGLSSMLTPPTTARSISPAMIARQAA
jgi:acyl transferase domain-containing protein